MRRLHCSPVWVALFCAVPLAYAQDEVYRCAGTAGRPYYTNVKKEARERNCKRVTREVSVVAASSKTAPTPANAAPRPGTPGPSPANASASNFPRVDASTQKSRDQDRKQILLDEMHKEERALTDAKEKYAAEQARTPDGTGSTSVDRLLAQREAVERHERNIASLKREIGDLK